MAVHDFIKVHLIEAFVRTQNFNILCLPEILIDSTTDLNVEKINDSYSILKAISFNSDPSNSIRGSVFIYFKQTLPLFRRDDINAMQETTVRHISVKFYILP